jgi:hypothetical protein
MSYDWYREIDNTDELTQGDLISDCLLLVPNAQLYEDLLRNQSESSQPVGVQKADVIVVSQACDIDNDKIDSIVVCPTWDVGYFAQQNTVFRSSKKIEDLCQGNEPPYHLINSHAGKQVSMSFRVVDFHHIYAVPKSYLQQVALRHDPRLRLLPPYREHLSQAFARYFMRVGLPSDISRDQLKAAAKLQ